MTEMSLLAVTKETDNKVRRYAIINGTQFELYIPQWRVPEPVPTVIEVSVEPVDASNPRF